MVINHNMSAEFADRAIGLRESDLSRDIERLSSGVSINRAGDNASGLAVATKLGSQIRGLHQASKNAQDGISFIQTTEGYLENTSSALQRIRELAIQAANGVYSDEDRMQIQVEVSQMINEIDRVASYAQFNGMNMLTGRFSAKSAMSLQVGANMDQNLTVSIKNMSAKALGIKSGQPTPAAAPAGGNNAAPAAAGTTGATPATPATPTATTSGGLSIQTAADANITIGKVDSALKTVLKQRADLGAYQNRLEMTVKGLDVGAENLLAAQSRIQDTNMAKQMSSFAKNQILVQSAAAMIAQANQKQSAILRILG